MAKKVIRPIGYISPGGFIKTAKGWRKAPKRGTTSTTAKLSTIGSAEYNKFDNMSISKLKGALKKYRLDLKMIKSATMDTRNAIAGVAYSAHVLDRLGFTNLANIGIKVRNVSKGRNRAQYSSSILRSEMLRIGMTSIKGDASMQLAIQKGAKIDRTISISGQHKGSFVHEYFHALHNLPENIANVNNWVRRFTNDLKAEGEFDVIFAQLSKRGYRASQMPAEIVAQFGNQHVDLSRRLTKPALTESDIAIQFSIPMMDKWGSEFEKAFKGLQKAMNRLRLVVLLKGRKLHYRMEFQGLPISIENRKGSIRRWYDPLKKESGETKMKYAYGYIRTTEGADGDSIDCYIGPNKESRRVFVVHQNNPKTGKYDEDKVMLGFDSSNQARVAYLMHYDDPKFFGSMKEFSIDNFQDKVIHKQKGKITGGV